MKKLDEFKTHEEYLFGGIKENREYIIELHKTINKLAVRLVTLTSMLSNEGLLNISDEEFVEHEKEIKKILMEEE